MKMLMLHAPGRHGNRRLDRLVHVGHCREAGRREDAHGRFVIGAGETDHDGDREWVQLDGGDNPIGHIVGAGDPAEDVEQDDADAGVAGDDAERSNDFLGIG